MACALDSNSELSLMLSAGAGNSSGKDLSSLADELSEFVAVLVINEIHLVRTENADLFSSAVHRTCRTDCRGCFCSIHLMKSSYSGSAAFQKGRSSSVLSSSNFGADEGAEAKAGGAA